LKAYLDVIGCKPNECAILYGDWSVGVWQRGMTSGPLSHFKDILKTEWI